MNTLNNKIALPDDSMAGMLKAQMAAKALEDGFKMISIDYMVYSCYELVNLRECSPLFSIAEISVVNSEEPVKFRQDFDALYIVSMFIADECIGAKGLEQRFSKLEEEYHEVIEAFAEYNKANVTIERKHTFIKETFIDKDAEAKLISELADLQFVLFHIGKQLGSNPKDRLHQATSKMLARMNDSTYKAKN